MMNGMQLVMPLNCEINIGKNAPVRLLNAVMERMDCSKLYAAYSRLGRIEYSPKILMKIMVYKQAEEYLSDEQKEALQARYKSYQGAGYTPVSLIFYAVILLCYSNATDLQLKKYFYATQITLL